MYSTTHQIAQRVVDDPVPLHRGFPGKMRRDDEQSIMPAAARAGVSRVLRGIIFKLKPYRGKKSQLFPDQRFDVYGAHAGNTFLNGLIVTLA